MNIKYKIRRKFTGINSPFYVNVAVFHLPTPKSILIEPLEELPIVKVRI